MAELTVQSTYASALFGVAKDKEAIDDFMEEIIELGELFKKEISFFEFFTNPTISAISRKSAIKSILEGKIRPEILNFLYILIDKNRGLAFPGIVKSYKDIRNSFFGVAEGVVYSAVPLSIDEITNIQNKLSELMREKVKLINEVDSKLIGGFKIFVNGKIIDASLKSRLGMIRDGLRVSVL